jgi:segregation and condensation protein B
VSDKTDRYVEAALFIAGKPISVKDIASSQNLDARTIRAALNRLIEKYSSPDTAIEVVKLGTKYAMQVKEEYRPKAEAVAPPELSKEALKVASLIGYYQPILQSKLAALAGPQVYEGVKELEEKGLIRAKPKSRSFELTTTSKFIEYFGIDARSRSDVKRWFEKKLKQVPSKD